MKANKVSWPLVALMGLVAACEEKSSTEPMEAEAGKPAAGKGAQEGAAANLPPPAAQAPTPPPPPPPPPMPSPAEVCANVVAAVKSMDDAKIAGLSTPATTAAVATKEAKDHLAKGLGAGTCGAAKVDMDKATVTVTIAGAPVDVPFVKLPDGWKFDGAGFLEKNPAKAHGKKAGKGEHGKGKHKAH